MPKTYRLAILANVTEHLSNTSVLRYTHITAYSYKEARTVANQIGALICGWRVSA